MHFKIWRFPKPGLSTQSTKIPHVLLIVLLALTFANIKSQPFQNSDNESVTESFINPAPEVIPGLREWQGKVGFYEVPKNFRIVVENSSFSLLEKSIEIFAGDLKFFFKHDIAVVSGSDNETGIFISLNPADSTLGREGYKLSIDNGIRLEATTPEGIFTGTRTILQLLNLYGNNIPKGRALDYPMYERRGFMLDVGRKFFRLEFLQDYIRILSYYKMNEFHVHLNDNGFKQFFENDWNKTYSAFRLESETYPGLAAEDGHYTKDEFRQLQELGIMYGVNVIPEIDVPAHSLAFT